MALPRHHRFHRRGARPPALVSAHLHAHRYTRTAVRAQLTMAHQSVHREIEPTKPILYSYWRSSCSWRVRIALELKGIEYENRPVHLVRDGGEQKKEEYAALNPQKLVPCFIHNGNTLTQSMAILEYLEEVFPGVSPLLPADPVLRAKARAIAMAISCDIQPVQNLRVLQYVGPDKKMEWGKHWITEGFRGLERLLEKTAGQYCVGDTLTVADACLVPQVYNANRFSVDMSEFPIIARVNAALVELDAVKRASPEQMPDAQ